ncbi:MAG: tRNA threonylcarbamoyladenosine dehydratase [Clostridia bacterium]|nr:tRNA threonylcarbamoyladenosine dehydratase [Clostridia bacterium]
MNQFSRTELLIGADAMEKLHRSRVAVFGVGGVGGYVVEALARSGVGTLDLIDNDEVSLTNLNRQIIATHATLGMRKVDAAAERVRDICPEIQVNRHNCFFLPENADTFDFSQYDYVVDAVDTVSAKLEIVLRAQAANVPVISSMGAGNKLDPSRFRVADIYSTKVCPLARAMRNLLKRKGVKKLKVVYSEEEARTPLGEAEDAPDGRRATPGSMAFVPAAAGLILAGEVVRDLIEEVKQNGT